MLLQTGNPYKNELYKSAGVLWRIAYNHRGHEFIHSPLCPNQSCHTVLTQKTPRELYCVNCNKNYPLPKDYDQLRSDVQLKFEGFRTINHPIYSLDLPPTKVIDEDNEDDTYWVQAKIVEKDGKKMAVIYFGERVKNQSKQDYTQLFIDFDDEQVRFDKLNKNPMKLLSKLIADFQQSTVQVIKKTK